jgi:hypothetical protein
MPNELHDQAITAIALAGSGWDEMAGQPGAGAVLDSAQPGSFRAQSNSLENLHRQLPTVPF